MLKQMSILSSLLICLSAAWAGPVDQNRQFDFAACQTNHNLLVQTYNGNSPFSEERTSKIKNLAYLYDIDFAHGFLNNFLAASNQTKISKLNKQSLQEIYSDLRRNPYFPFEVIETQNCFMRARLISLYLINRGVFPLQAVASGDFQVEGELSHVRVHWDTHTTLIVEVPMDGGLQKIAIDPSLSDKPITLKQWADLMKVESPKLPLRLSMIPNIMVTGIQQMSQKERDFTLKQTAGAMARDLFYIFDRTEPLPERFTTLSDSYEALYRISDFATYYMRKSPRQAAR